MRGAWRAAFVMMLAPLAAARAHPAVSAIAFVKVSPDGHLDLTLHHDALAFALNETPQSITDPPMIELLEASDAAIDEAFADAHRRFSAGFMLMADGKPVGVEDVEFPTATAVRLWLIEHPDRTLPLKLDIVVRATLPKPTRAITLRFPPMLGDVIVTVDRPGVEPIAVPLLAGETTPSFELSAPTGPSMDGAVHDGRPALPTGHWTSDSIGVMQVMWRYVRLGFGHIIPAGLDHALFVLGLFLLSPRFKTVLWQITAFTVAHTITLTLTSLHIIGLSSRIVEPTIAASIAFIGVENLLTTQLHPWRPVVAFIFGLVHGMGIATAFNEAGFPQGQLVESLAAFTVGVEAGHIMVLVAAFALLGWWRNKRWYRKVVTIPISSMIAVVALIWMVQRL